LLSSARSPKRRNFTNTQKKNPPKKSQAQKFGCQKRADFYRKCEKKRGKLLLSTFFYQLKYLENGALKF